MKHQTKLIALSALIGLFLPSVSYAASPILPSPQYYYTECYPLSKKTLKYSVYYDNLTVKRTYCDVDICYKWGPKGEFLTEKKWKACIDVVEYFPLNITGNTLDQSLELQNENTNFESSPSSGDVVSAPDASSGETSYGDSSYGDFSYEGSSLGE